MTKRKNIDVNPFNSIISILFLVLVFMGLYFIATSIFKLLALMAPFLLIGALVIDYKVVLNYGKWLVKLLKENFLLGIGAGLLTFFGFPVIAGFLFGKAYLSRKVNKLKTEYETQTQGEFVEFEEVTDESDITPKLELPPLKRREEKISNEYEELFDDEV